MKDPALLAHQEWLGYLQPVGLVVSPPALVDAQAGFVPNSAPLQQRFLARIGEVPIGGSAPAAVITDLHGLLCDVFGWQPSDLLGGPQAAPVPDTLAVVLPEYNETLRPTYVVREFQPEPPKADAPAAPAWLLLIQVLPAGTSLDRDDRQDERHWKASPQARFERLLRETQVPIGLLVNGIELRLVYAPRGESSGQLTFPVHAMTEVAGRPILAALHMLLRSERLFTLPAKSRLPAILASSRKYQNNVSTRLAEQVLGSLFELLRGFQAADHQRKGELLREVLNSDPNQIYAGLLTVLLRLVFLLYAEDRGLMSGDSVYVNHYSVTGLFERLRADAGRYPDTMDQRYGAWAQLIALFRIVHNGAKGGGLALPARKGYLFDPERYRFLEGRLSEWEPGQRLEPPMVSDGVVFRVLNNLLILDGERLSYRTLDVEQIGSVYEAMMGFRLEKASGPSIAVRAAKSHGAPTTISLAELLAKPAADRGKWLKERTDQALTGAALNALKAAKTPEDAVAALGTKVARVVTPNIVPAESMILQPSDERRRSGSHYTPRSLTEPIVRTTLKPVLERFGPKPTPEQILSLKVCDPAMGSGAFLVETCRQLGEALVVAWRTHNAMPSIPPDEDELLHARRLIAQRCVYGVDKNPMAVDLAKLSLWLATLAKDHPFTFLDHVLRSGDSLVGLTQRQIAEFHWLPTASRVFGQQIIEERIQTATRVRQEIIEAGDDVPFLLKKQKLALAEETLNLVRFAGNLVIAAFFAGDNDRNRKLKREELLQPFSEYLRTGNMALRPSKAEQDLLSGHKAILPFHWEIEFPEVFGRSGFDVIVGNPPFLGGSAVSERYGMAFFQWLVMSFPGCRHRCDLVAYFFRRAFALVRNPGSFGLIATNTIAQGDTREGGLFNITTSGGVIYGATRRLRWPGQAAVIVSVVHVSKGLVPSAITLDGEPVRRISAYLLNSDNDHTPVRLSANPFFSNGSNIYGQGFVFDDEDPKASPDALRQAILERNPECAARILPYIGGEEINSAPTQAIRRHVISMSDIGDESELDQWPELKDIIVQMVKPERMALGANPNNVPLKRRWWAYQAHRPELYSRIKFLESVLACSQVSAQFCFARLPTGWVYSHTVNLFCLDTFSGFSIVQSRIHEIWARLFASSMKDDMRYTPSDCFETFPFPENFAADAKLEAVGKEYYEFRAALMVKNNEGLTKTYNRFHDPSETSPDIARLRELHAAMDRAVLDAYGWTDLQPTWQFLLDYVEEEEEVESGGRARRKPYRYRWPDDFRDEVLARLLALNKERAEQEALAGKSAESKKPKSGKKPRGGKKAGPSLFAEKEEQPEG